MSRRVADGGIGENLHRLLGHHPPRVAPSHHGCQVRLYHQSLSTQGWTRRSITG